MKDIIKQVAATHGVTTEERRQEMAYALHESGIEIESEVFIVLCVNLVSEHFGGK